MHFALDEKLSQQQNNNIIARFLKNILSHKHLLNEFEVINTYWHIPLLPDGPIINPKIDPITGESILGDTTTIGKMRSIGCDA